jgi:hypothetical protein
MPARAQAGTATSSVSVPIEESLPGGLLGHPCGTGDVIHLTGDVHIVEHRTTDATGGVHHKVEVSFQGLEGVGLVSGTSYRAIRATNIIEQSSGADVSIDVTIQRLVAIDGGPDFWLRRVLHFTYNANGELTVQIVKVEASCSIVS